MKKTRVLYVSQETTPFLPETEISKITRHLPQGIHESGKEIRAFMPKYGCINERRHQLHEVIRLSGMNLIIDDTDHPLIIKVASIPTARLQVYFIDNEEYFHRKAVLSDDSGKFFEDNDERSIFFCRGVLETVKKLGWSPDIIHCHGWVSAVMPFLVKKHYHEDPHFSDAKVVYSAYSTGYDGSLSENLVNKLAVEGVESSDVSVVEDATFANLNKLAIQYSDACIWGSESLDGDVEKALKASDKPVLEYQDEDNYIKEYSEFYDRILEETSVLAD